MGLMPAGAANPFSSVDQRTAYGAFKASGSFDPDALYAQKETMIAPYKNLKRLAVIGFGVGGLFTVTIAPWSDERIITSGLSGSIQMRW